MHDTRVGRIEAFGAAVSVQDRDLITKQNDVNKSYEGFVNTFNELYYSMHCLLRKACLRNKLENRPWFTKGLANACKKNNLYKKYIKYKTMHAENKSIKHKLTNILRYAKRVLQ